MKKWLIPLTVAAFCVSACDDKNSTQATAEKPQVENTQSQKMRKYYRLQPWLPHGKSIALTRINQA